jgi:hypothetical protein
MKRKMRTLVLIGRRWFNRSCGNTYHSVQILADGKQIHYIMQAYGADQVYEHNAKVWLFENGWLPDLDKQEGNPGEALWRYCERMGIEYTRTVTDVSRKKDL